MINNPNVDKLYLAKYDRTFKFNSIEAQQKAMHAMASSLNFIRPHDYMKINEDVEKILTMGHHLGLKVKAEAPDAVRMIIARNNDLNTGHRGTLNAEFIKMLKASAFESLFYYNCEPDQQPNFNTYIAVVNIDPSHPAWGGIIGDTKRYDLDIRVTTPWWFK